MRHFITAAVLAASLAPALPALADPPPWAPAHGRRAHDADRDEGSRYEGSRYEGSRYEGSRYDGQRAQGPRYDSRGRYLEPQAITRDDRVWRGSDGRYYCRRDNGTTGLVIGAALGALVGRELDGGRNRTLGTVLGAAAGGLLGREIDRGGLKCR